MMEGGVESAEGRTGQKTGGGGGAQLSHSTSPGKQRRHLMCVCLRVSGPIQKKRV